MASVNTFAGRPLRDPADLLRECLSRNLPYQHWHGRATVAAFPAGRRHGTAEFLMLRGDLQTLDLTKDHDLILSDFRRTLTAKRLSVLAAEEVLPGLATDAAAVYLVTAVDRRHHLDRSPFSQAYNVPDGAGGLVAATTNGGTPWTWATMFADLWARLPSAAAGTAPTLPFTPDGRPEGWRFWGHPSAWQALCDVLDRLCCTVVLDPTTDTFAVERLGSADAAATAFETAAKSEIQWDGRPVVPKRVSRPEKVSVRFRRSPVPADGSDPFYAVAVALTPQAGTVAGTTVLLADDLTALGSTGTPSNAAALATRAAERAADYERALVPAEGVRVRAWRGVRPEAAALPGAGYGGVAWGDRGAGWATEASGGAVPGIAPELGERLPTGGGTTLDTRNSDNSDQISATTKIISSLPDGLEFVAGGTENTLKGISASPTQKGMVTENFQVVGGGKQLLNGADSSPCDVVLGGATSATSVASALASGSGAWVSGSTPSLFAGDFAGVFTGYVNHVNPFTVGQSFVYATPGLVTGLACSGTGVNAYWTFGPSTDVSGYYYLLEEEDSGGILFEQTSVSADSFTERAYSSSTQAWGSVSGDGETGPWASGAVRHSVVVTSTGFVTDIALAPLVGTHYQQGCPEDGSFASPVRGSGSLDYYFLPHCPDIWKYLNKPATWGSGTYVHESLRLYNPTAWGAYRVTSGSPGSPGTLVDQTGGSAVTGGLTFVGGLYISGTLTTTTTVSASYNSGTKDLTITVNGMSTVVNLT